KGASLSPAHPHPHSAMKFSSPEQSARSGIPEGASLPSERRRRGIVVETASKRVSSPVGAKYAAPDGASVHLAGGSTKMPPPWGWVPPVVSSKSGVALVIPLIMLSVVS